MLCKSFLVEPGFSFELRVIFVAQYLIGSKDKH